MSASAIGQQPSGDPGALFRCERLRCSLTRSACANSHRTAKEQDAAERRRIAAQLGQRLPDGRLVVVYRPCLSCPIGAAHLRGQIPSEGTINMQQGESASSSIARPDRMCRRGKHLFTPVGREHSCAVCAGKPRARPERTKKKQAKGRLLTLMKESALGIAMQARALAGMVDEVGKLTPKKRKEA